MRMGGSLLRGVRHTATVIRDEIIKKVFWVFAATALGLAVILWRMRDQISVAEAALSGAIVLLVGIWAAIEFRRRKSFRLAWYPKVGHHFLILDKTYSFSLPSEDGTATLERRIRVKALVDNLDHYVDRFVWTGGPANLPAPMEGCVGVNALARRVGIWTYYSTEFGRTLRKGEELEFAVRWLLSNWRDASPFISTSTEEPTKKLKLLLQFPPAVMATPVVLAEVSRGIESNDAFSTETLSCDASGRLEWSPVAKLYRHYRLRWAWAGESSVQPLSVVTDQAASSVEETAR